MGRIIKQIVYGALYLIVLAALSFSTYLAFREGEPNCAKTPQAAGCTVKCDPCILEIKYDNAIALPVNDTTSTIVLEISNPSSGYGLRKFDYTFNVFHKFGVPLTKLFGSSSLYPGEKKYLFQSGVDVTAGGVGSVDFATGNLNWQPAGDLPPEPVVAISQIETSDGLNEKIVSGMATPSKGIKKLRLLAVGLDADNNLVSGATTDLDGLTANTPRSFTIFLPKQNYQDIKVYSEVVPD